MKLRHWLLPSFRSLLAAAGNTSYGDSQGSELDITVVPHGAKCEHRLFNLPNAICREFLFDPLLIELSVIQPSYYLSLGARPSVVSHIVCEVDDAKGSVLAAYDKALRFLAAGTMEAGRDPIVAHPGLYSSSFVAATLSGAEAKQPSSQNAPSGRWDSFATYSWEYERGTGRRDVTAQVTRLGEKFLALLCHDLGVAPDLCQIFRSSHLLVVPLLRPDVSAPLSGRLRKSADWVGTTGQLRSAGGGLFLLLRRTDDSRPQEVERGLRDLATYLQRELLLSALEESHGEVALQKRRVALYEEVGHTLKTMVQITGWSKKERNLRSLATNLDEGSATVALQAANALALFGPVQGLGELIRLVGILGRKRPEDLRKLRDWVDPRLLDAWMRGRDETVLKAAADTIFHLARAYCMGAGWPEVRLTVAYQRGIIEDRTWAESHNDLQDARLRLSDLCMPPFLAGSDALFSVMPIITEPVANAVRYLRRIRQEFREIPPLRFYLSADLPDAIVLEIGNAFIPSEPPPERLPPGLELAGELLQDADICSFAAPFADEEDFYWIPLRLHPQRLALRILGAIQP